ITSSAELRAALTGLALDLAFASTPEAEELFARLDGTALESNGRSPIAFVRELPHDLLERALTNGIARDVAAIAAERAAEASRSWWRREHAGHPLLVAYFCMEFGLHESLPIYSGGLGVLAGDHLKGAAAVGVPLVAVGLLYRNGYFRQSVDEAGRQIERYAANDPEQLPVTLERSDDGTPLFVEVELADERVAARVWRVDVGSVRLYLLDTDVDGNSEQGRQVADVLYGGDREHRLRQEVLLGVGGVRALAAVGLRPTVFHANEGHSTFLVL